MSCGHRKLELAKGRNADDNSHFDVARSLHVLRKVCLGKGGCSGAKDFYEQSLCMEKAVHGGERAVHAHIAATLHGLGNVCVDQGD